MEGEGEAAVGNCGGLLASVGVYWQGERREGRVPDKTSGAESRGVDPIEKGGAIKKKR